MVKLLHSKQFLLSLVGAVFYSLSFSQSNTPCGAPALPVNAGCVNTAGTTVGATQQTNAYNDGLMTCGSAGPDVWYSFVAPASGSVTINTTAAGITDGCMALYNDPNGCNNAADYTVLACDDDSGPGLMPMISQGGLTPGVTYFIRFWKYGGGTGTFNICVVANAPPPPCAGDIAVNTTYYSQSGLTTCGFGDDYSSADACGSSYMNGDDIVIEYTPNSTGCVQIALSNTGTYVGLFITDGCPNDPGVSCLASATASGGNPSISGFNVSAGQTYYLTVSTWPSPQCTPFNINITACPPPPPNDECANATVVPVNPLGANCASTVSSYTTGATSSYQGNSCGAASDDDDVWFTFTATSTDVSIALQNISGSTTDMYHSVWDVSCGSVGSTNAILCSDPNTSTLTGLTIGNTYLVRVYTWSSTPGLSVSFDICISELGPCGISQTNEDNCPYPATLTQGPGSWSSSTYPYYTADTPANSGSIFCGSVENNSWYEFTALSTTEVFNFSVSNCINNSGIQAQVYNVTTDAQGCCTNFSSVSNCWNPGTQTSGTVTATGLTIGNTYILMVDGYGGDNCEFTVNNWTAQGIQLPVELVEFKGVAMPRRNVLQWKTAFEENNDYFSVLRSYDDINFEKIGEVNGAGQSNQSITYFYEDYDVRTGVVYYKLEQVDFDGARKQSDAIAINRTTDNEGLLAVYPNPVETVLFIDIHPNEQVGEERVELLDSRGNVVRSIIFSGNEFTQLQMDIEELSVGVYFVRYMDSEGKSYTDKVIKK